MRRVTCDVRYAGVLCCVSRGRIGGSCQPGGRRPAWPQPGPTRAARGPRLPSKKAKPSSILSVPPQSVPSSSLSYLQVWQHGREARALQARERPSRLFERRMQVDPAPAPSAAVARCSAHGGGDAVVRHVRALCAAPAPRCAAGTAGAYTAGIETAGIDRAGGGGNNPASITECQRRTCRAMPSAQPPAVPSTTGTSAPPSISILQGPSHVGGDSSVSHVTSWRQSSDEA
jgi:hypothetical protein